MASYEGTLYFGILGCRELVPEVAHLGDLVTDAFAELLKAAERNGGPLGLTSPDAGTARTGPEGGSTGRGSEARALLQSSRYQADVAQLVEHHLAKVRVAGSNPVVRSKKSPGQRSTTTKCESPRHCRDQAA